VWNLCKCNCWLIIEVITDHSLRGSSYKIIIYHLVSSRSPCADFCFTNEGPQTRVFLKYLLSLKTFRDQNVLGNADVYRQSERLDELRNIGAK